MRDTRNQYPVVGRRQSHFRNLFFARSHAESENNSRTFKEEGQLEGQSNGLQTNASRAADASEIQLACETELPPAKKAKTDDEGLSLQSYYKLRCKIVMQYVYYPLMLAKIYLSGAMQHILSLNLTWKACVIQPSITSLARI